MPTRFRAFAILLPIVSFGIVGCTSVERIITDGGFIYTDPPSQFNSIGSMLIVQRSGHTGTNVLTEVCHNAFFQRDLNNGRIVQAEGEERVVVQKVAVEGAIDVTAEALKILSDNPLTARAGFELLKSTEIKLSNVRYLKANIPYVEAIAREIGASEECGGVGGKDEYMEKLRRNKLKTYHVYMAITADTRVENSFKAGATAEVQAAINSAINVGLKSKGVIQNSDTGTGRSLNLGYRLWDPDCPGTRIDFIPSDGTIGAECR